MKSLSAILIVSCILFITITSGCGNKEEENRSTKKDSDTKNQTQQQTSTQNPASTNTSAVGKIWTQIEKINSSMGKGISSNKSGHLEEPVAEIITLLKSIPENSPNLEQASLEILKSEVNELRKTGDKMDKYQHSNKTSELKEEYAKFNKSLNEIKSVIPG